MAAVDGNGKIVALRDGKNALVEPNQAKLYIIDKQYYGWNEAEGKLELVKMPEEGLVGEVREDPVEGVSYLYAVDENGQAVYRWDVATPRYQTVAERWRKLNLMPFSEYHKPTYSVEYTYESEDGKISFPLHIGLSQLPVKKIFFKEPMIELMGE